MHFSVFFFSNLFIIFAGVSVQILCTYLISFSSNWDLLLVFMPHIPYQVCNFQILSPALYPFILLQFFVYLFVQIIHPIKNTGGSDGKKKKKKNLPAVQLTQVLSLGWEAPLKKEMTTHSYILAWRIPWTEELGRLQSMGSHRVGYDRGANSFFLSSHQCMYRILKIHFC